MMSGLLLVIVLVCKAMGGWYFLAAQICGFTAFIQLLHGTGVAVAVSMQFRDLFFQPGSMSLLRYAKEYSFGHFH